MRSNGVPNIKLRALVLILVFLFAMPVPQGSGHAAERRTPRPSEYAVKAAFVYNFIKFVEWPSVEDERGDTFKICILGEVADLGAFKGLHGEEVKGKHLLVASINDAREASACAVLFISENQSPRLRSILEKMAGSPTLTVGDTEGFAQRGIMINLFLENKRVRFEINEERARASGLRISTKLLKLASKVYSE